MERLVNRHQHLLAWNFAGYLNLKREPVLIHWACLKVSVIRTVFLIPVFTREKKETTFNKRNFGVVMKVRTEGSDKELLDQIVAKLSAVPGISYADVASAAFNHDRTLLATKVLHFLPPYPVDAWINFLVIHLFDVQLLDYEPRASEQVPLLLQMKEDEVALSKAIQSGDTDLGEFSAPSTKDVL